MVATGGADDPAQHHDAGARRRRRIVARPRHPGRGCGIGPGRGGAAGVRFARRWHRRSCSAPNSPRSPDVRSLPTGGIDFVGPECRATLLPGVRRLGGARGPVGRRNSARALDAIGRPGRRSPTTTRTDTRRRPSRRRWRRPVARSSRPGGRGSPPRPSWFRLGNRSPSRRERLGPCRDRAELRAVPCDARRGWVEPVRERAGEPVVREGIRHRTVRRRRLVLTAGGAGVAESASPLPWAIRLPDGPRLGCGRPLSDTDGRRVADGVVHSPSTASTASVAIAKPPRWLFPRAQVERETRHDLRHPPGLFDGDDGVGVALPEVDRDGDVGQPESPIPDEHREVEH